MKQINPPKEVTLFLFLLMEWLLFITVSYMIATILETQGINTTNEKEFAMQCANKTLSEAVECLNNEVSSIFKYNLTPDTLRSRSLAELKEKGGDCRDWSFLYARLGKYLGFHTKTTRMMIEDNIAHRIAIFSDKTGYCIIDQTNYECFPF